jgi:NitT/TauT family transport system substrate-binding protein
MRALAVLLLLAAAPAVSYAQPAPSASPGGLREPTTLRLGLIGKLAGYWSMWAAQREGYFDQEKIVLKMTFIDTDARLTDAVLAGAVDVDPETVLVNHSANEHGADMRMFCGNQNLPFYRVLGRKGLTSLKELAGKRIGVSDKDSGVDSFVLQEWLSQWKLEPKRDYTLINAGGLANRVAALQSGAIDATALVPPFDLRAKAAGLVDLGQSTDYIKHFMFTAWSARERWLKANRPLAVAFCRAIIRGARFVKDPANKDKALAHLMDATGIDQATAAAIAEALPSTLSDGRIDRNGFAPWAKYLNVKPDDVMKLLDESVYEEALASVK